MPAPPLPTLLPYTTLFRSLMDVGVKEALAPLGVPDTARLIVPPVPTTVVEMVLEPLVPCTRLRLLGLAEIVKFGLGARSEERRVGEGGSERSGPGPAREER